MEYDLLDAFSHFPSFPFSCFCGQKELRNADMINLFQKLKQALMGLFLVLPFQGVCPNIDFEC